MTAKIIKLLRNKPLLDIGIDIVINIINSHSYK